MPVNLLTLNQSDGTEAGNTTGLIAQGTGVTLTSDTGVKRTGSRSAKGVCTGASTYQGIKTNTTLAALVPKPMTVGAWVYVTVTGAYRFGVSSSTASWSSYATPSVTLNTWTYLTHTFVPPKVAADGVLTFDTGNNSRACTVYVDEWGIWEGVGGDVSPGGREVLNVGGANTNTQPHYAGLAPISTVQKEAIAAGISDAQMDWIP